MKIFSIEVLEFSKSEHGIKIENLRLNIKIRYFLNGGGFLIVKNGRFFLCNVKEFFYVKWEIEQCKIKYLINGGDFFLSGRFLNNAK